MKAILYMIGTLLLVNGILLIGRGSRYGALLMATGVLVFLVNLLLMLRKQAKSPIGASRTEPRGSEPRER